METPAKLDRISPDITCLSYNTSRSSSSASVAYPGAPNTSGVHSNTISEVPVGLYEFIIGNNGEVKILCKICQYKSNKKSNFKRHFTNMHFVHNEDSSKMLECCGIRFTTKGEKFQHTKSVHKSGYKCTICSKVFDRPALLQRHLAKHTGKKPYKCSLCAYQTPNKANAKRHIEKKHSDVQQGSILFVTDDGEQIQMEVVSKGVKDVAPLLPASPSLQSTAAVVKSNADSTSFVSSLESTFHPHATNPIPLSANISLPRSRSASVTSSSLSPPGHLFVGPLTSVFHTPGAKDYGQDQKQKITHSIDMIMKQHAERHFMNNNNNNYSATPATTATCCIPLTPTPVYKGNNASVSSPENLHSVQYSQHFNHQSINEQPRGSYCLPNWTQSSTAFSTNNDYAARNNAHPLGFLQQSTYTTTTHDVRNQGSSSLAFQQCAHGCWHHIDNQMASDFSHGFQKDASSSFVPTHFCSYQSPDSRSSSSSISQQTENSSITSLKSEDENDSDIIDVVGDDDESGDDSSKRLQLLGSICDDLDSFTTKEIPSPEVGNTGHFIGPPAESVALQRMGSFSGSDGGKGKKEQSISSERYVPKKLRVAKGHYK